MTIHTTDSVEAVYEAFLASGGRVSTDSRQVVPGSLFFALRGPSFDGNRYAAVALAAGAAYVVVDDPEVAGGAQEKALLVDDVLTTLQDVARLHRMRLGIPILAITGSNGKTTTKELVSRVLARKFRVSVTAGNLNNHIGVPLTLLAMDRTTEFGVVEMGASAPGEIALLCGIASPNYGIITNVGRAHLEGFGGFEGVKRGKGEMLDYLAAHGGEAFYPAGSHDVAEMVASRRTLSAHPYDAGDSDGFPSSLVGDYNRLNIAAAVAVGRRFDIGESDIAEAIASYAPDNQRSQAVDTLRNSLIVDCYNANPSSMRAALENFAALDVPLRNGIRLTKSVILGDMRELGEWSRDEHRQIVDLVRQLGLEDVFLVGEHFTDAAKGVHKIFPDINALCLYLDEHPLHGRFILIKGSRGIKLETALEKL